MARTGFEAQQLVELLAVVSTAPDVESAANAAVECAAHALEAEFAAVVVDGRVTAQVGFGASRDDADVLAGVAAGRNVPVEVPGVGVCAAAVASFGDETSGRLVIARDGFDFAVEEYSLIRGMARMLGMTLRMLRTLDAERRQRRLMHHLYAVQRAISRRMPLHEVLELVVGGLRETAGGADDVVSLWLVDTDAPEEMVLVCAAGDDVVERTRRRLLFAGTGTETGSGAAAGSARTDQLQVTGPGPEPSGLGRMSGSIATPVHEHGRVAGSLVLDRRAGPPVEDLAEQLLAFAEHVSLAVTDARTQHEMHAALHDSLTGLASRQLFLRKLAARLADGTEAPVALLFIDLDRFKQVNDSLGHATGDLVLIAVAHRINSLVRAGTLAARLGGDEFAVLLEDVRPRDAVRVADRLVETICMPIPVSRGVVDVGASIGIATAVVGSAGLTPERLIRHADVAMYEAKRGGRSRGVLFQPGMDSHTGDAPHDRDVSRIIDHLVQPAA